MSQMSSVIPAALEQAMASAGVEPQTSVNALAQEAASDNVLHQAFESEVCRVVTKRLARDTDFIPEKYPNADQFFNQK